VTAWTGLTALSLNFFIKVVFSSTKAFILSLYASSSVKRARLASIVLIISHSEDLKDRARVYYDENEVFNNYLDYFTGEVVISI
jgi:hypothetical protein